MALHRVEITSDVFWTCVTHALTTEAEEIMGLLLGDIKETENGESVARIWFAMPQIRTDRRKDRVEASPEQMVRCAAQAEEYSKQRGVRIRVIGWYHSHPHITVLPSHVDVRTQASYQQLDEGFVGLIFSTFDEDATTLAQRAQVTAFQSVPAETVQPNHVAAAQLMSEEGYDASLAQALAASAQEARHHLRGELVRKEVPLDVIQTEQVFERSDNLFGLMRVMFREEQSAFRRAVTRSCDKNGTIHPLAAIHYGATYQQHMCQLIELVLGPTVQALENYKTQVHLQMQRLKQLEQELKNKLAEAQQTGSNAAAEQGTAKAVQAHLNAEGITHLQSNQLDPQPSLAHTTSFNLGGHLTERHHTIEASPLQSVSSTLEEQLSSSMPGTPLPDDGTASSKATSIREMRQRLDRLKTPPPQNGADSTVYRTMSRAPGVSLPSSPPVPADASSNIENKSLASNTWVNDKESSPFTRGRKQSNLAGTTSEPNPVGVKDGPPMTARAASMPDKSLHSPGRASGNWGSPAPDFTSAMSSPVSTFQRYSAEKLRQNETDGLNVTGYNPAFGYSTPSMDRPPSHQHRSNPSASHLTAGAVDSTSVETMVAAAVDVDNPMMESGTAFVEEFEATRPNTSESASVAGDSVAGEERKRDRFRDKAKFVFKGVKTFGGKLGQGQKKKDDSKPYIESESILDTNQSSIDREPDTPPESPDREAESLKGKRRIMGPKKDRPMTADVNGTDDKKTRSKKMLGLKL